MSKESLDNILLTLETHPCGVVQRELLNLWNQFKDEQDKTFVIYGRHKI